MLRNLAIKGYKLQPCTRTFSTSAAGIRDRFEEAWTEVLANKVEKKIEPKDKETYGTGYYQRNYASLKKGYEHPYHSEKHPLVFSSALGFWNTLKEATGPEQVSPHYESVSRSRRGLIFIAAYIGTITTIAQLGGWNHNEWIRGLIFHHEFLLAFYIGYIELRHFTWLPGPKFTVFYDVFSRYEYKQLMLQWADTVEAQQHVHLQNSREQIEYQRIHNEYLFVKKRAVQNYLVNSRIGLERHFHQRTLNLLRNVKKFELANLSTHLNSITTDALASTLQQLENNPEETRRQAFEAALEGIRKGKMDYSTDPVLPILKEEINKRTTHFKNLTPEQESEYLQLTDKQKDIIAAGDKVAKNSYVSAVPNVHSPSLKAQDKFKRFTDLLNELGHAS